MGSIQRKSLRLLAKMAVSIGLLTFLVRQVSWDRAASRLNDIALGHAVLALIPLIAITLLVAYRWHVIASALARPVRFLESWSVCMIGTALDQVLVMMSGDAYRIYWLKKGAPSFSKAVAGVLLDRLTGVLGIAVLVIAFLPRFAANDSARHLLWLPAAFSTAIVLGLIALMILDRIHIPVFSNAWLARVALLSVSARKLFLTASLAIPALSAAVLAHMSVATCVAVLASALGVELRLAAAMTVVPTVMLIALLPVSIGGWGVRESAMVVGLGIFGVDSVDALLISVMYGLGAATIGASGGILWLFGLPRERAALEKA